MSKDFVGTEGEFWSAQCRFLPVGNMAAKARGALGCVLCFITLIPGLANHTVIRNNPTAERALTTGESQLLDIVFNSKCRSSSYCQIK